MNVSSINTTPVQWANTGALPQLDQERYEEWLEKALYPAVSLSWDQLKKILSSDLVFRHVSSHEEAHKEAANGFRGDAISISSGIYAIIYLCAKKGILSFKLSEASEEGEMCRIARDAFPSVTLTDLDKKTIVANYKLALWKFILHCLFTLDHPVHYRELEAPGSLQKRAYNLQHSSAFLLLKKPESDPYDNLIYFGLGKAGRQRFSPEDHVATLIPSPAAHVFPEGDFTTKLLSLYETVASQFFVETLRLAVEHS